MSKKISSKDFLDLLDEQENSKDRIAFKPKQNKIQLSPVQKELLQFALDHSPKFVTDIVKSKRAEKFLNLIQSYSTNILNR